MAQRGERTDGWTNGKYPHSSLSPIGATALPPPMKTKEKVEQGKGTADHLMPLGYLFAMGSHYFWFPLIDFMKFLDHAVELILPRFTDFLRLCRQALLWAISTTCLGEGFRHHGAIQPCYFIQFRLISPYLYSF